MRAWGDKRIWLAAALPTAAFVGATVVFAWLLVSFRADVGLWARRDLRSQAELAAESLREPLRTQDFRKLTEFHRSLESKEMILRVRSSQGGWIFHGGYKGATVEEYVPCGDYLVGVAIECGRVYAPFYEALAGFAAAVLVGVLGMFLVFFVLYRQRVRMRELARLERFRRDFIADVSHEIKTPLTGILGAVDMLEDGSSPLVGMIRSSAKRLNRLVQSILDLARLERDGEVIRRERVDLARLMDDLVAEFRPRAVSTGVSLTRVGERELSASCDPQLIAQAVGNLVENAIRYAHSPTVVVSLFGDGAMAHIAVEDRGVGIAAEHRVHVFERFYRIDTARSAESGGAGLGLAIVQRIAHLHGGEVVCEAVQPSGVRFTFNLSIG